MGKFFFQQPPLKEQCFIKGIRVVYIYYNKCSFRFKIIGLNDLRSRFLFSRIKTQNRKGFILNLQTNEIIVLNTKRIVLPQ